MPRAARAALLIVVVHVVVLGWVGRSAPGPLLSNLSMIAAGALAATACWRAASRGVGFSRSVWRLFAIALGVWSAAQASWTVTENVLRIPVSEPSLTHFLFRFCGAPLIVALLLDEEEPPVRPPDWARVLDFAQIGIVFLFFYFDLYFVPPAPGDSLASLQVFWFLDISDIENWLIAAAYQLRAFLARTPEARRLFWRISLYVVAYAACSTTYNYGYYIEVARTGHWFELPWTAALGVATLVATSWQPRVELARSAPTSAMRVLTVGWVPAVAPIAVLALALQVARYELALAFFAVLASVSVFGARLLVERYRQLRALEALRASEERYARLVELSPDAIAVFADGRISFANPRRDGCAAARRLLAEHRGGLHSAAAGGDAAALAKRRRGGAGGRAGRDRAAARRSRTRGSDPGARGAKRRAGALQLHRFPRPQDAARHDSGLPRPRRAGGGARGHRHGARGRLVIRLAPQPVALVADQCAGCAATVAAGPGRAMKLRRRSAAAAITSASNATKLPTYQ